MLCAPAGVGVTSRTSHACRRRRPMLKIATAALATLAAVAARAEEPLPRAAPESVGMSSERLARLDEALKGEVERGRLPGAVIAIARRGKLVHYEAYGYVDPARKTPM